MNNTNKHKKKDGCALPKTNAVDEVNMETKITSMSLITPEDVLQLTAPTKGIMSCKYNLVNLNIDYYKYSTAT